MSDSEERIHYITIFDIIPPLFGAIVGGLLGLLLSWRFGFNPFLCLALGGYSSTLMLLALFYRLGRDQNDSEVSRAVDWRAIRFGVTLYLVVATVGLLFVAMWPLKSKLDELRERQLQPQESRS